jgi:hypothetical protein
MRFSCGILPQHRPSVTAETTLKIEANLAGSRQATRHSRIDHV